MNPTHRKGKGKLLEDFESPKGLWEYSEVYRDVLVAHEWNMKPEQFWSSSRISRAFMIAYCEATGAMQSIEMKQSKT
jgi:hypothetical protein